MKFFAYIVVTLFALNLIGCASQLIEVKSGSDLVALVEADQVKTCQSKGVVNVSVLTKVGFISRSVDAVEQNLLQLARNNALEVNGDTLVKDEMPAFGKRSFLVYKCKP